MFSTHCNRNTDREFFIECHGCLNTVRAVKPQSALLGATLLLAASWIIVRRRALEPALYSIRGRNVVFGAQSAGAGSILSIRDRAGNHRGRA